MEKVHKFPGVPVAFRRTALDSIELGRMATTLKGSGNLPTSFLGVSGAGEVTKKMIHTSNYSA
jgi:hypothetical protein